jgi:integrase
METISRGKTVKRTWTWKGRKRVAYVFDVIVDGQRIRRQFDSKTEAQDELDAFKEEQKRPKPDPVSTVTIGQSLNRLLDLKVKKQTVGQYQRMAEHLMAYFGADTPLSQLTADRISEYKAKRLAMKRGEQGLTAAAINRPLALLRHLLRQAKKWKLLVEVPDVELKKEPQGRLRWLKPEEATRLLEACRQSRNPALTDLVEFTMFTGLRQGEALGLTWDRVDRARGVGLMELIKSGYRREVPLSANADAVLGAPLETPRQRLRVRLAEVGQLPVSLGYGGRARKARRAVPLPRPAPHLCQLVGSTRPDVEGRAGRPRAPHADHDAAVRPSEPGPPARRSRGAR